MLGLHMLLNLFCLLITVQCTFNRPEQCMVLFFDRTGCSLHFFRFLDFMNELLLRVWLSPVV